MIVFLNPNYIIEYIIYRMGAQSKLTSIAVRIGIFGGIGTFILINSIPFIYGKRIRESDHYIQAIQMLYSHPEALKYLGEPITEGRVNVTIPENYGFDEEKMWIKVPVQGPKSKGYLYYDFFKDKKENGLTQLSKVELTIDSLKGYKLLIKNPN